MFHSIHQENICKSCLHSNLIILTNFHSFTVNKGKHQNKSIWRFLPRSTYVILAKICKSLNLLNSVLFIKKTWGNHIYIQIWHIWLTFTVLQWMKTNFKICQFVNFCLCPGMWFWSKFENDKNFLILFHSSRKHEEIIFTFDFDHFDWLSQLYRERTKNSKLVNLKISAKIHLSDFGQNLKMTKTPLFFSIRQENICKSCLLSNLIILTDFHSFAVNEDKLRN